LFAIDVEFDLGWSFVAYWRQGNHTPHGSSGLADENFPRIFEKLGANIGLVH